jgi:hypothetical protein
MQDHTDSYVVKKPGNLWSLPMRLAIVGRTGAGKTNVLGNILAHPDWYRGDWKPENVFIISGSLQGDAKLKILIRQLDIPKSNLFDRYDPEVLDGIYDELQERYNDAVAEGHKPEHSLIILDDVSYTGRLAAVGAKDDPLLRVAMNGRKFLVSLICTAQKYSQLATALRENLSGAMIASSTNRQMELIEQDMNTLPNKKLFHEMFRRQTANPHDYLCVNWEHPAMYLDHDLTALDDLKAFSHP